MPIYMPIYIYVCIYIYIYIYSNRTVTFQKVKILM